MSLCWLITYENEGKKGNDLSTVQPFRWLIKYKEKLPDLVLTNWTQENIPMNELPYYDEMINIEKDYPEVFKEPEPEPQPEPEPDPLNDPMAERNDDIMQHITQEPEPEPKPEPEPEPELSKEEELRIKRSENLKKARAARKKKAEE